MADEGKAAKDLPSEILQLLSQLDIGSSLLSSKALPKETASTVKGAIDSLRSQRMVDYKTIDNEEYLLEIEGQQVLDNGSHEIRVLEALRKVRPKTFTPTKS